MAQMVKNLPEVQETRVQSLVWEDPLEQGMATHSSILAWRIPMERGAWHATVYQFSSVTQLCPTLCDPMDYSLPGSSALGILQARILEWVAISLSRGSSQFRNRTQVSCVVGRFFTV